MDEVNQTMKAKLFVFFAFCVSCSQFPASGNEFADGVFDDDEESSAMTGQEAEYLFENVLEATLTPEQLLNSKRMLAEETEAAATDQDFQDCWGSKQRGTASGLVGEGLSDIESNERRATCGTIGAATREQELEESTNEIGPYIVDGRETKNHPVVMLSLGRNDKGRRVGCSGTVVSRQHILTSAHCAVNRFFQHGWGDQILVELVWRSRSGNRMGIKLYGKVYPHATYRFKKEPGSTQYAYDLALLSIPGFQWAEDSSLHRMRFVSEENGVSKADELEVFGYGYVKPDDPANRGRLRTTKTGEKAKVASRTDHFFTAKSTNGLQVCEGDSGGPAVGREGRYQVVKGVLSGGKHHIQKYCSSVGGDVHWTNPGAHQYWLSNVMSWSNVKCRTFKRRYVKCW